MDYFEGATAEGLRPGEEHGAGAIPILLIHGWLDSWKSWTLVLNQMKLNTRIIAVTLRGWGDSEKVGKYTIEAYSRDIIEFLKSKGITECVLCGHSMGTLVATSVAAQEPNLIKGLILCGATAKMPPDHLLDPSTSLRSLSQHIAGVFPDGPISTDGHQLLDSFQCDDLRPLVQAGLVPQDFLSQVFEETLKATPRSYREAFQDMIDEDHTTVLGAIACPVLIIWGSEDVLFDRSEQINLQSLLQNSSQILFREVEGAPHGVIWTHAKECADLIQEWYQETYTP
jgi:non-heme chloroperoxidase